MKQPSRVKVIAFLLVIAFLISPVLGSINTNGNESKYRDNNPAHALSVEDVSGTLIIHVRAGGSAEDLTVFIAREGGKGSPIDNYYHPDRSEITGQNPGYLRIKVLPDGNSEYIRLVPGNYTAYMRNSNAGQPEQQSFVIEAGHLTHVSLLGHAVDLVYHPPRHTITIIRALWGAFGSCAQLFPPELNETVTVTDVPAVPAWDEYIYHPEVNETFTVTDLVAVPAWDEYIYHPEVNETVTVTDLVAVEAWDEDIYHPEVNETVTITDLVAVEAWDEYIYHPEVNHTEYRFRDWTVDVPGTDAWTETSTTLFPGSHYVKDADEIGHYERYYPEVNETRCHEPAQIQVNKGVIIEGYCDVTYAGRNNGSYTVYSNSGNDWNYHFIISGIQYRADNGANAEWDIDCYPAECTTTVISAARTEISSTYFEGSTYVVDSPEVGHYELFHPSVPTTYTWSEWSLWSDMKTDPVPGEREVETRVVQDAAAYTETVHHPALPAVTHEEIHVITAAYTETVHHPEIPAVTHEEIHVITAAYTETVHHPEIPAVTHEEIRFISDPYPETECSGDGEFVDVTSVVEGLVDKGRLHIASSDYSSLFGGDTCGENSESCPMKSLIVDYRLEDISGSMTVPENVDLNLPDTSKAHC